MNNQSVGIPIVEAFEHKGKLAFLSDYWLLLGISHHLEHCFNEVVGHRGFLGEITLSTRLNVTPGIALLISSLPDGRAMLVDVELSVPN